jgi:Protein of unknown function (DUF402)
MDAGDTCIRREVWRGLPWSALATNVIEDSSELFAVHVPIGAPFGFVDDHPLGIHPWSKVSGWSGQDIVMAQRPGERYSIWFFGEVIYINLQDSPTRTSIGFDTFDHELDIIALPDGTWSFKDDEKLETSIELGRFDANEIAEIRHEGARIGALLDSGNTWWTQPGADFRHWTAPNSFLVPSLPLDWQSSP